MGSLADARRAMAGQSFSVLLGAEITEYGPAGVVIHLAIRDAFKQNNGFVHGGVIAYLADVAVSFAAGYAMGNSVVTAEIKVNYLRPAIGERLIARGTSLSAGRTQGVARCDIWILNGDQEALCAAAQGTMLRLPSQN